jgi:hypothetical protein
MASPDRKLCVEPMSTSAVRHFPLIVTGSSMVFAIFMPASAWRETTKAVASTGP